MCGIFGVIGHEDAARLTYFGLYALQHRGQESAGIAAWDDESSTAHYHAGMGLVPDVFTEEHLRALPGRTAIGHVRPSTTGRPQLRNAQPLVARMRGGVQVALAHNGNLTNAAEIRRELEDEGCIFQTTIDSEIFVHLIARALTYNTMEEAIQIACNRVEGAYSLVIMADDRLIAVRDPHGLHPLSIARMGESWVFASESCAFDLLEAEYLREVEPGEMVVVEPGANAFRSIRFAEAKKVRQCIFELVYFARPDSRVFGEDVYQCRKCMGRNMMRESMADAECVIPFPDSGIYSSLGAAQEAGVPYEHALIRNHYVGRTFIQPSQSMRQFSVRVKINPVRSMIENRSLYVVDDSIVRGTTIRTRVAKLRQLGAKAVHFRVSSPPIKYPCFYGIDFPSPKELIATKYDPAQIAEMLGLDSLHYLSLEGLLASVSHPEDYCTACFTGDYPTPLPEVQDKMSLEHRSAPRCGC
ncbi:MAG: amidophosphoribosyltransferase [Mailhella sp.]|nr:amidophosphoribosyltransferase [Mailhella sp.]